MCFDIFHGFFYDINHAERIFLAIDFTVIMARVNNDSWIRHAMQRDNFFAS